MKAYLIDSQARTVTETDYNGDYQHIYKLISVETFTVVRVPGSDGFAGLMSDCVFVDDEGLLNNPRHFFTLKGYPQPLAGNGLVLGTDDEGESVEPRMSLDDLRAMVGFVQASVQGFVESEQEEETAFGRMMVFRSTPVFGPPEEE